MNPAPPLPHYSAIPLEANIHCRERLVEMTNSKAQISNKCQSPNNNSEAAKPHLVYFPPNVDKTWQTGNWPLVILTFGICHSFGIWILSFEIFERS